MKPMIRLLLLTSPPLVLACLSLCWANRVQSGPGPAVRWRSVPDLPRELLLLDSVFWEPLDTQSLRKLIREQPQLVRGKSVLEIGTGSGLIALCCRQAGAETVVASDINPHAIACASANARRMGHRLDIRLVDEEDSRAFTVLGKHEKFDLIVSNPPWEDDQPTAWADYALYDPGFELLRSILEDCRDHLRPGGRVLLAYGCDEAIQAARRMAPEMDLQVLILDERDPDSLPDVFLPGMLLGMIPNSAVSE